MGTGGYMVIEGWSLLDAIYMTVITMTTTGFEEVHALSMPGRVFTLILIVMGMLSISYTIGRSVQAVFESQIFRRRRMSTTVEKLDAHYIICGYGKMGRNICDELHERNIPFVIIEMDTAKIDSIREHGYLFVHGDATRDEILSLSGIEKARGLAAVLRSDADNVFTTLSASSLNENVFIVARAVEEESEPKLLKAGATRVVKPYETAGTKIAELLLRPGMIDFFDIAMRDRTVDLNIEEFVVLQSSPLAKRTLAESSIRRLTNVIIVAINRPDGKFIFNPESSVQLDTGDKLIALGERKNLIELHKLCALL